jgi:DNA-binding response OmpR family regulator
VPEVGVDGQAAFHLSGFELIRRLRAVPAMAAMPIVAMTASATSEAKREARQAGAADLLAKPFNSRALLDRLQALNT